MWMQRCVLGAACLACVIAVADRGAGAGDNGKAKHDANLRGREYHVQLTLYEMDKNGHRKVFGNSTISTPEGEEFNYLSGGEFPMLVDQQVDWAQFGVSAHGKGAPPARRSTERGCIDRNPPEENRPGRQYRDHDCRPKCAHD
jgi:hypothetical protein